MNYLRLTVPQKELLITIPMMDGYWESGAFDYTKFIRSCLVIYHSLVSGPKGAGGLLLNMKNGFKKQFF